MTKHNKRTLAAGIAEHVRTARPSKGLTRFKRIIGPPCKTERPDMLEWLKINPNRDFADELEISQDFQSASGREVESHTARPERHSRGSTIQRERRTARRVPEHQHTWNGRMESGAPRSPVDPPAATAPTNQPRRASGASFQHPWTRSASISVPADGDTKRQHRTPQQSKHGRSEKRPARSVRRGRIVG